MTPTRALAGWLVVAAVVTPLAPATTAAAVAAQGGVPDVEPSTSAPTGFPTKAAECTKNSTKLECDPGDYCDYSYFPSGYEGHCRPCIASRVGAGGSSRQSSGDEDQALEEIPRSCVGNTTEECIQQCFPDLFCSEKFPCTAPGQWCAFQLDQSGLCTYCTFIGYPGKCNEINVKAGRQACQSTCFNSCNTHDDCKDGSFCAYEEEEEPLTWQQLLQGQLPRKGRGYCTDCTILNFTGNPSNCYQSSPYFTWSKENQESCLTTCFETCTPGSKKPEQSCGRGGSSSSMTMAANTNNNPNRNSSTTALFSNGRRGGSFCNLINGNNKDNVDNNDNDSDNTGYCKPCDQLPPNSKPNDCFRLFNDTTSAKDCASTCFGECTISGGGCIANPNKDTTINVTNTAATTLTTADPISSNYCALPEDATTTTTTTTDAGYCTDCSTLLGVEDCFAQSNHPTTNADAAEEHCAATCFGKCSNNSSCPDGTFCNFQNGDDDGGYCSPCSNLVEAAECMTFPRNGQESCVTSCFVVCSSSPVDDDNGKKSSSSSCPSYVGYDHVFCDYQLNQSMGACAICPFPDPETCTEWNTTRNSSSSTTTNTNLLLTTAGQESCINTCFRPCQTSTVVTDCGVGHTCTLNGYCLPLFPFPPIRDSTTSTTITRPGGSSSSSGGGGGAASQEHNQIPSLESSSGCSHLYHPDDEIIRGVALGIATITIFSLFHLL